MRTLLNLYSGAIRVQQSPQGASFQVVRRLHPTQPTEVIRVFPVYELAADYARSFVSRLMREEAEME